jgi:hypothetical protein
VGNGENVTVEKIRDIKDGTITCDYILPMNPSLWRASIGGKRRYCTSKAWIRVELQEEIPPPAKKVKLLPSGPGQLERAKSNAGKNTTKPRTGKRFQSSCLSCNFLRRPGTLQADGECQQPNMSGCEAEERDEYNMVRLKLEGYFFIGFPASLWTGLVTEHARLKMLAFCNS